jgi:hypothetical protein
VIYNEEKAGSVFAGKRRLGNRDEKYCEIKKRVESSEKACIAELLFVLS